MYDVSTEVETMVGMVVVGLAIYLLPLIVALGVKSEKIVSVFLINFFLGWTVVGWIVAMVMALGKTETKHSSPINIQMTQNTSASEKPINLNLKDLAQLAKLRDDGILTETEFREQKAAILGNREKKFVTDGLHIDGNTFKQIEDAFNRKSGHKK